MNIIDVYDKKDFNLISYDNMFKDKKVGVIDIETTGFNRKTDSIVLIGLLYVINEKIVVKQFFNYNNSSKEKEREILINFLNTIKNLDYIVTYNGYNFDMPFIYSKLEKYKSLYTDFIKEINEKIIYHIDIYNNIIKRKEFLNLENYKLKNIEKFLGIKREDSISGKESIEIYYKFLKENSLEKKEEYKNLILLHNREDILLLIETFNIIEYLNIDNFSEIITEVNLFKESRVINVNYSKIKIKDYYILFDLKVYNYGNNEEIIISNQGFELKINKNKAQIKLYFENLEKEKNIYYYIKCDNRFEEILHIYKDNIFNNNIIIGMNGIIKKTMVLDYVKNIIKNIELYI